MKRIVFLVAVLLVNSFVFAQHYTIQDSLRGGNFIGRQKWDVLKYNIEVEPNISEKTISGKNEILIYDSGFYYLQIDLQQPMQIDSAFFENKKVNFSRNGNVYFLYPRDTLAKYKIAPGERKLLIYFSGKPKEAVRPPWDGGWIWRKDKQGNPWISVACQGLGASVWYPCKDSQADEPDNGMTLKVIVPDSLDVVGNGREISSEKINGTNKKAVTWSVVNPINNYNIVPYIGKYAHWSETYPGIDGPLSMDYYVLRYNEEIAKEHFKDAPKMMKAFEYWFGPYPFYKDGYKLVESPHLGMEHQSAVAYGNQFKNGYLGQDRSGSGEGDKFDFIIIHESGHEWFGNNITSKDIADMWIHESFTNYSEALFVDYYWGKYAASKYVAGERQNIGNQTTIIGDYGVNEEGSGDMYDKGGNMIHFIRQVINNDKKFREILVGLNKTFWHQTVTTKQVENFINSKSKIDFNPMFNQYLRTTKIPELILRKDGDKIIYHFENIVSGFNYPIRLVVGKKIYTIKAGAKENKLKIKGLSESEFKNAKPDIDYYIRYKIQ